MRKRISAVLLALAMVVTSVLPSLAVEAAQDKVSNYEVVLPENHVDTRSYPVIYVMPEDGFKMDNSGMVEKLQAAMKSGVSTDMIIVTPEFKEGTDLHAAMENLVAEVDAKYNTLEGAANRAIVGTGVGGYLAYILGLTEKVVTVTEPAAPAVEEAVVEEVAEEAVVEETAEEAVAEEAVAEEAVAEEAVAEEAVAEEAVAEEVAEEVTEEVAVAAEEVAPVAEEVVSYKALTAPKLFKYVVSTRGDFSSDANKWTSVYGEFQDYLDELYYTYKNEEGKNVTVNNIGKFYTYLDAPVSDKYTDMKGSTDDLGNWFLGIGMAANVNEFTVRTGSFTDEFFTESVNRIADRLTSGMVTSVASGSISLAKAALTKEVKTVDATYNVTLSKALATYTSEAVAAKIVIDVVDSVTGEILSTVEKDVKGTVGDKFSDTVAIENLVNGTASNVVLSLEVLGIKFELASATLTRIQDTVVDGDYQYIDLMGDWYFHFNGLYNKDGLDVKELLSSKKYEAWPVVQPALTSWAQGFGDVQSAYGGGFFGYGIIGDGYYVRTFDLPADFDAKELVLSVGYMDDRGQAFLNGELVGETGMTDGVATGDTTWAVYSYYTVDASVLKPGETNTIVVRCQNDGVGGGGWYGGPVALYSKEAFESDESTSSLFEEYAFDSEYAAKAQGKEGTVENKFLVYLPEGYHTSDKYYPTLYLMHQFNSDHTSYIIDDIDTLVNEAIKQALVDEMIVVVPNSSESGWWAGDWMKMVSDELVPLIDENYRTIDDARYRMTGGCSMGGQGAFGVALQNPDLFSGAISFFGAFSYGGNADPRKIAEKESAEYLDNFSMYFICGNQDNYKFGRPAIDLHQSLLAKNVDHEFFIDNGEHNSAFYVPHFVEALVYTRDNMFKSDDAVEKPLAGSIEEKDGTFHVSFEALEGIEKYFNTIPASSYTKDANPDLNIPLIIEFIQNGKVVYEAVARDNNINAETLGWDFEIGGLDDIIDLDGKYTVVLKAAIFDRVVEVSSKTFNAPAADDDANADSKDDASTSVKTGDEAPVMLYLAVAMMAAAVAVVVIKRRRA